MISRDSLLINERTLVLQPNFERPYQSRIILQDEVVDSKFSTLDLLNQACMRNYSTYKGRIEAIRMQTSYARKTPLIIGDNGVEAFPTMAPTNPECMWIFNHDFEVFPLGEKSSRLRYAEGLEITVNTTPYVILKQRNRLILTLYQKQKNR